MVEREADRDQRAGGQQRQTPDRGKQDTEAGWKNQQFSAMCVCVCVRARARAGSH